MLRGLPIAPTRLPAWGTFLVPWRTSRSTGAGESFGFELESHVRAVTLVDRSRVITAECRAEGRVCTPKTTGILYVDRRQPRTVLFVTESIAEPFEAPLRFLQQQACVQVVPTLNEAISAVQQPGMIPDLIVITQAYPQSCPTKQLDLLRQRVPLAKIVVLCGIWCEGGGRTARPWPGTIRLYWHQFSARISTAWLHGQYDPFWSLPATSSDAELFLAANVVQSHAIPSAIAIAAGTRCAYDALADICQRTGQRTYWVHPRRSQPGLAMDCGIWDDSLAGMLDWPTFQQQIQPASLILLCNFPRIERRNRALGSVPFVLGKPFLCRDLIQMLARLREPAPLQPATRVA